MNPRKALITSAAVAATLVGASTAMALNGGILSASANDSVGTLNPTATITDTSTAATGVPGVVALAPSDSAPVTTSSASTVAGYDSEDSDEYEYDDSSSYDDDHEYEGHDSDD